jgi:hypothetical protein
MPLRWNEGILPPSVCATRLPNRQKPAACFARRVKFAAQKYLSFRKAEIMI